jgi:hypothetical protein
VEPEHTPWLPQESNLLLLFFRQAPIHMGLRASLHRVRNCHDAVDLAAVCPTIDVPMVVADLDSVTLDGLHQVHEEPPVDLAEDDLPTSGQPSSCW